MTDGLAEALAQLLGEHASAELAEASRRLSARYRSGVAAPLAGELDVLAYAATRMPATAAAAGAALAWVAELLPDWQPRSHLDLGAGTGSAAWAATSVWPGLEATTLLERDPAMATVGARLARAEHAGRWSWQRRDVTGELPAADLVTACYLLGELEAGEALQLAVAAWRATTGCLVLVEPGTPVGFDCIRRCRTRLLAEGARLVAPCPEEGECPVSGNDWCHFAARLGRSALHRALKGGERSFEDEKFSYVAFAAGTPSRAPGRVVRRPRTRRHFVELTICAGGTVDAAGIGRSRPSYRTASRLGWGSAVPGPVLDDLGRRGEEA